MHRLYSQHALLLPFLLAFVVACAQQPSSPPPEPGTTDTPSPRAEADRSSAVVKEVIPRSRIVERLHHGVDISVHSGAVDWRALAASGHSFAFAKATEGVDLRDPAFDDHWRAMKEAGIVRGAYHFYVTEDDPETQARFFIDNTPLEPGDLAPVVDIELIGHGTEPGLPDRLATWLRIVEEHYGIKPIIYTAPNFWDAHLTDAFGDYPLWIAEYGVDAPRLPKGWKDWHLWQWRGDARLDGIEKDVDLSRLNRESAIDLAALVIPNPGDRRSVDERRPPAL